MQHTSSPTFATETWSPTQHPSEVAQAARHLVRKSIDTPITVTLTRSILGHHLPPVWDRTGRHAPAAIFDFLRNGLRFIREPHAEWVADLEYTCNVGGGDCDDLAVAAATIAMQTGIPTWICWRWTGPAMAHMWTATGDSWVPTTSDAKGPVWHLDPFSPAPFTTPPTGIQALRC